MDNKKLNKIPDRIDRIDNMLKGKSMDSIIDSDDKIFKKNNYEDYESSEDIRNLVPKKYIDFVKAINELGVNYFMLKVDLVTLSRSISTAK